MNGADGVEPAVAQDILDSHDWDLQASLKAFSSARILNSSSPLPKKLVEELPVSISQSPRAISIPVGRPLLQKNDAVEIQEDGAASGRKWSRGISRASENLALVTRARSEVAKGFTVDDPSCVPSHTFTLPDLTAIQPEDFRAFVENDLIETATLVSLEQSGRLNWWSDTKPCQRLLPLATTGDGNCLLHAASLGIWGFHDRLLTLRKSLNHVLSKSEYEASIYRRWRWHQTLLNKQSGLVYTESEWDKEWFGILKLSSTEPRLRAQNYVCCDSSPKRNGRTIVEEKETETGLTDDNTQYESLEEVHVFALAYAIKRPIIVIADVYLRDSAGEPLAPIPFGGIYLPLGCDPKNCLRCPLVLTYDAAHFSALVPMKKDTPGVEGEGELPAVVPVTDSLGQLLPILFLIDPGESFNWGQEDLDSNVVTKLTTISQQEKLHILDTYIDLVKITVTPKPKDSISGASSGIDERRSTADSNESETSSGGKSDKEKNKSGLGLGKHMKSVRMKLKRSISKLTRRSSEENDVGVVKNAQAAASASALEKNVAAQNLCGRSSVSETAPTPAPPPVSVSDVDIRLNANVGQVCENGSYRWKVESVKDVQSGGLLGNPSVVLGCPLSMDHETSYHEQMVANYLSAARSRFANHQKDRDRRENLQLPNGLIRCANQGCDLNGSVSTNYLCPACFNKQKAQLEEMKAQRETTTIGKSTFYSTKRNDALSDIEENPSQLNNQRSMWSGGVSPLPRPNQVERLPEVPFDLVLKPCATPDCGFFGHEKSDYLCSQCYRNKKTCTDSAR